VLELSDLQKKLLNDFQRNFPLTPKPYADIAKQLGVSENDVLEALNELDEKQCISRIGAIIPPNQIGVSTLAAMSIPENDIERVAAQINQYTEVNHNYEREHVVNLWFVLIAQNAVHLKNVISSIENETSYPVLRFPLIKEFFIDLSFRLDLAND
jgi:DNA-binding Lrp family transcriptional regulator